MTVMAEKHLIRVSVAGSKAKLWACYCRCGWSTALLGTAQIARSKGDEHIREVGEGRFADEG